jgi:glycerol-3-phosphate dehydrogenase
VNIAILGAGAWGTALGINLSATHAVTLWARDPQQIEAMQRSRSNERYLPGHALPAALALDADAGRALAGRDCLMRQSGSLRGAVRPQLCTRGGCRLADCADAGVDG